ncbi:MAG: TM0996/MTH895 family glutaredoxin-like protein [Duodenibacillus sp.]|nr:TM0996/MTH895 family glutaredoxin-like protein [Duodenibacillus sp.]
MKDIRVFGPGCGRCQQAYELVLRVVDRLGFEADVRKVDDMLEMLRLNVLATPTIVVDGEVKFAGRVPSEAELERSLNA